MSVKRTHKSNGEIYWYHNLTNLNFAQGGVFAVVNANDMVKLFLNHKRMKAFRNKAGNALLPCDIRTRAELAEGKDWSIRDKIRGQHVNPTSFAHSVIGIENIDHELLATVENATMRQLGPDQMDTEGNDVSGFFVVADAARAFLFSDTNSARRWSIDASKVNISTAPSLTYIESGNATVSYLKLYFETRFIYDV